MKIDVQGEIIMKKIYGDVGLFDHQVELIVKLLRESDYYNCSSIERYDLYMKYILFYQTLMVSLNLNFKKTADPEADRVGE